MKQVVYIYALVDPDGSIRYVGQSDMPERRLSSHRSETHQHDSPKARWLRELIKTGKEPIIQILERTTQDKATEIEAFWIAELQRRGEPLVNICLAGLNGKRKVQPESVRLRMLCFARRWYGTHRHKQALAICEKYSIDVSELTRW